jgi:hypothetical protein
MTPKSVCKSRDSTIVLGASDAPSAMLAGYQATSSINSISVRIASWNAKNADVPGAFIPTQHSIIGDVAPHQRTVRRKKTGLSA